jgi:hypothetical protein
VKRGGGVVVARGANEDVRATRAAGRHVGATGGVDRDIGATWGATTFFEVPATKGVRWGDQGYRKTRREQGIQVIGRGGVGAGWRGKGGEFVEDDVSRDQ